MSINQNSTRISLTRIHPLWVVLVFYYLITIILYLSTLPLVPGRLAYPLDDTYIHMAIAKNFIQHGVWGISAGEFSSSSSSPLWTFLIAIGFRLFGIQDWLPAVLNLLAGTATIYLGYSILKSAFPKFHLSIVLILVTILSILPVLTLMGMEHTLHTFLTLLILYLLRKTFKHPNNKYFALLLLTGVLLPLTRYEGIFTCLGILLLFIYFKNWKMVGLFALSSFLPIVLYGFYSVSHGWYFIPNSVLLKGNLPQLTSTGLNTYFFNLLERLLDAPHLFILVLAGLLLLITGSFQKRDTVSQWSLGLWVWTALLHLAFAKTAWFYRYEAYLVFPGLILIGEQVFGVLARLKLETERSKQLPQLLLLVFSFLLAALPSVLRAGKAMHDYPLAVKNNYDQQYQMVRFIQQYYPDGSIALNDIGAVSYYTKARILDLWGLASKDVARQKISGTYTRSSLTQISESHAVELAILYPYLYQEILPDTWVEVGQWQIMGNVVSAFDTVTIYASDPSTVGKLVSNLQAFSNQLPGDVIQSGMYLNE